jgi:L-asparaginase
MQLLMNGEGRVGADVVRRTLEGGGAVLDAIERGIRVVEANASVRSVGRGGAPNLLGAVACDAAIMDGSTRQAGAVAAMRGYLHAISVARQVMERLPHVLLVGEGAERFAAEVGAETAEMLTDEMRRAHEEWLARHVAPEARREWPEVPLAEYAWASGKDHAARGTVIVLAQDAEGHICAGASTSGWARAYPGRVGDSPIVGAGLYADSRYGACACTHIGEMTIRAGTSRAVVAHMQCGASVEEACRDAMRDLDDLRGGYLGPVVVHAMDRDGRVFVLSNRDLGDEISYVCWRKGMAEVESRRPQLDR